MTSNIEESAQHGADSATKEWFIAQDRRGGYYAEPTEEIEKHDALRKATAEHFDEAGLSTFTWESRKGYEDRSGRSDEGYWPYVETDYVLSLTVSWAESE